MTTVTFILVCERWTVVVVSSTGILAMTTVTFIYVNAAKFGILK